MSSKDPGYKHPNLNIANICGGAIPERFDREMDAILANISDPNTGDGKRRITITLDVIPDRNRQAFTMACKVESKLSPAEVLEGHGFIVNSAGKITGYANNPQQLSLLREEPASREAQ